MIEVNPQQALRDLHWLLTSPNVLNEYHPQFNQQVVTELDNKLCYQNALPLLKRLENNPQPLLESLSQLKGQRLGIYFEALVQFLLQNHSDYELIATRLPVASNKRTYGEFDFIFRYQNENFLRHWETTVKFYLQHQQGTQLQDFIGPNAIDRLDLKVSKIFEKQLPLSQHSLVQNISILQHQKIKSQTFFKGYLFYHINDYQMGMTFAPQQVAKHHLSGWWCDDVTQIVDSRYRWVILPRLQWLSPALFPEQDCQNIDDFQQQVQQHFTQSQQGLLVAKLEKGSHGLYAEVNRGFIVANNWPLVIV